MTDQPDSASHHHETRGESAPGDTMNNAPAQRRTVILAIAIGAVIAVAAVFALGFRGSSPSLATSGIIQGNVFVRAPGRSQWEPLRTISAPIVAGTALRASPTGRLALTLGERASLRIDAESDLIIESARRFNLITGTAYVDVGSAVVGESYVVETPLGTVDDIASQIEVSVSDDMLRVRARDGDARVVAQAGVETSVSTGEQLRISADGDVVRDYVMPHDTDWTWVETLAGTPIVEGRPLTQFLEWVSRETGRPIRYDSPLTETGVATTVLRGSAENLMPMEALEVMLSTTEFDYSLRWDGSVVISPR
jgi:ferric-dicitrate binding protein FerR (iron transport regulator)